MTNFEKYKDLILDSIANGWGIGIDEHTKQITSCFNLSCADCEFRSNGASCAARLILWLCEEYQEPPVDWSKVAVDTKVLVSNSGNYWCKRYFAKRKDGRYYTWYKGATSWSNDQMEAWDYAKLAEEDADE